VGFVFRVRSTKVNHRGVLFNELLKVEGGEREERDVNV
jgi:hypothetical protein